MASRAEHLALFDGMLEGARVALEAIFTLSWSLRAGEQIFFTLPRGVVLRTFVLNHLIHHRGQLEVYLWMNHISLPAIYGPSADEGEI